MLLDCLDVTDSTYGTKAGKLLVAAQAAGMKTSVDVVSENRGRFATLVAHLVPAVMRRRPPEERSVMPYLVATAVSVGLVLVGTAMLGRPVLG